jgi:hypothetical protein
MSFLIHEEHMSKNVVVQNIPTPGQRVGSVCGPGEFAADNSGIVICQITDRWGTHAIVLMDSGRIDTCHGLKDGPGIGWHPVKAEIV